MRVAGNHVQSIWYDSESDSVKILSSGQINHAFEITADAFSQKAVTQIESAGGTVIYTGNSHTEEE